MAGIIIPTWQYYAMIAAAVLLPLLAIIIMISVFKQIPWAWTMYQCYRANLPCVMKHYPKGGTEVAKPELEKDLKSGIPHTYFKVGKWGLKFPDIAGDNTELLNGKLRIIHYYTNNVGPASVIDAVSLDRLKAWLNSKGINIQNKEDIILFFLNDYTKTKNIKTAIAESSIDDQETKKFILDTIETIEANRGELEKLRMTDGVFTFQAAMMALDRSIAFTSAAFSNAKSAIEAQQRAKQNDNPNAELYRTVLIMFVGLVFVAFAYVIISKSGGI